MFVRFLKLLIIIYIFPLVISSNAQAGFWIVDNVSKEIFKEQSLDSQVILVQGKLRPAPRKLTKPPVRPKAQTPKKPNQTVAKPPRKSTALPRNITNRNAGLQKRIQNASLPKNTKNIAVSGAASKFNSKVKASARSLAAKPLTKEKIQNARLNLRSAAKLANLNSQLPKNKSLMTLRKGYKALPKNSLTFKEYAGLKKIAQKYNTPIYVVGSRALGKGRNIYSTLPIGKGAKTRSDIDIRISGRVDISTKGKLSHALSSINKGAGQPRPLISHKPTGKYITISP